MLGFSTRGMEGGAARPLHWMDATAAREEPSPRDRQQLVPHPALGHGPQPRLVHPRHRPTAPARRLGRAIQTPRPCLSRPSSRHRASAVRSTRLRDGSMSESPRDEDATTHTETAFNRRRTSGSGRSEETGSEPSTDDEILCYPLARERLPLDSSCTWFLG